MPELEKASHEAFCKAYALSGNGSQAYAEVYGGDNAESHKANAARLITNDNVAARIDELKQLATDEYLWTREKQAQRLNEMVDHAIAAGTIGPAVAAIKAQNSLFGLDAPVKKDHSSSDGTMTPVGTSLIINRRDYEGMDLDELTRAANPAMSKE